jgi:hypothetical protein
MRPQRQTLRQIFAAPAVIGVLSVAGLLSALLGDGVWDGLSWFLLLVPVVLWATFVRRGRRR